MCYYSFNCYVVSANNTVWLTDTYKWILPHIFKTCYKYYIHNFLHHYLLYIVNIYLNITIISITIFYI